MKKTLGMTILIIIIILIGKFMTEENLRANSVYYIKNMEHKGGFEPELMLLIDNLDATYLREVEGMKYDIDGGNSINNNRVEKKKISPQFRNGYTSDWEKKYVYEDTNERLYAFDEHFKLLYALCVNKEGDREDLDISTIDEQAVKQELYEMMKPVLEVHEKAPDINLQWLFNLLNYEKFN